jgi:osmotically-inducible protein OsmY
MAINASGRNGGEPHARSGWPVQSNHLRGAEVATDIRTQICKALAQQAQRESARVTVNVHDGVVRLTGTVNSLAERRAACGVAWASKGVRWVVNQLSVD